MQPRPRGPSSATKRWAAAAALGGLGVTALIAVAFGVSERPPTVATPAARADISAPALPPATGGFSYQLGGSYAPEAGVQVVSRDRRAEPAGDGFYNVCYVNLLQTQPDEEGVAGPGGYGTTQWWIDNHPDLLLRDTDGALVIDGEWNEALFDVRTPAQRERLLDVQHEWFQGCADAGYQAIEPDNLDAAGRSAGLVSFAQTREYLKLVVPAVHDLGLAIAQKNTSDSPDGYGLTGRTFVDTTDPVQGFDFAIAEECAAHSECDAYTDVYGALVFEIEYTDADPVQQRDGVSRTAFEWICRDDGPERSIILRDRALQPPGAPGHVHREC
ncbi:endo alpha-1,4 polygalactosaminidase [Microbacterium sp. zg.Y625]|uniref:endo alpha-1,4 polygalactosaminidase n=1 Tax=Microbacterium jiangjiandongii TaxID=3049071 RepID=UPI00214C7C58|nr:MULTISPECIES: endo alpha-1,4 polygalactosaminidase [unclassified Microbacterium]MCR2792418.1 endo alpha-1,4 polygalactosaminidase [Microbacterium sp. zg.Y625]WIM26413.1 endo alpha-1,4 polygalactosaminidase [Microbacterium sp. zg-Y625]